MILFINSCIGEHSRTLSIARALLKKLDRDYTEVNLVEEDLKALTPAALDERTRLIAAGDYSHPMFRYAKQFAEADTIVIAAPYWDLSFPAMLKAYIENIYVVGIVSAYSQDGIPFGLCRADKLYYVTTAGGPYLPDYSYGYLHTMATQFLGIPETELIKAEMLDVDGFNAEGIVADTIAHL